MTPTQIIEKYEIPKEYHDAIFESYRAGGLRFAEIQMERWVSQGLVNAEERKVDDRSEATLPRE